jgi:hypothetical protein
MPQLHRQADKAAVPISRRATARFSGCVNGLKRFFSMITASLLNVRFQVPTICPVTTIT